ncbi:DNA ligase-like protein [Ralstonia phage phiITL-1]|uniref:DNA ligase-like protein n=1 Tax=Ralstonia phage phiITL-1 TaxID=1597967 RepID=A0A0U1ZE89_9CAUD|nr:DNA ligase [Ralstonia phage phiITL-1]AJT60812.1 DNA ligase-like protein [Ralstonia phage phiITL-1]
MSQTHYLTNGYHEFTPQGALKFNLRQITEALARYGVLYVARKVDGVRVILQLHRDGRLTASSRSSKLLPALQQLVGPDQRAKLLEAFPLGLVLDCEVSVKGRSFQEGCGDLRRKKPIPADNLIIWPIQELSYAGVAIGERSGAAFVTRRDNGQATGEKLGALLGITVRDLRLPSIWNIDHIDPAFNEQREQGFEGLILYAPDAEDRAGKVLGWWKVKPEDTIDGKVINWGEGEGKFAGMTGFVTVEYEDGTVGDVGTFEGNEDLRRLTRDQWIGRYVEVRYMERTDDGNLRHPVFVQFRDIEGAEGVKS